MGRSSVLVLLGATASVVALGLAVRLYGAGAERLEGGPAPSAIPSASGESSFGLRTSDGSLSNTRASDSDRRDIGSRVVDAGSPPQSAARHDLPVFGNLPRGLGASLLEVQQTSNAELAYKVAQALQQCVAIASEMEAYRERAATIKDAATRRHMQESFDEKQRTYSACQTVQADYRSAQLQMLGIALDGGEIGAASDLVNLGNSEKRVRDLVVRDAKSGHLPSLALVASGRLEEYSISVALQRDFQSALVAAARMPELNGYGSSTLAMAQRWYAHNLALREPTPENIEAAKLAWEGKGAGVSFEGMVGGSSSAGSADLVAAIGSRYRGK